MAKKVKAGSFVNFTMPIAAGGRRKNSTNDARNAARSRKPKKKGMGPGNWKFARP